MCFEKFYDFYLSLTAVFKKKKPPHNRRLSPTGCDSFGYAFICLRTYCAELQQCFSNFLVPGTIFQTEILRGTPSLFLISLYRRSKKNVNSRSPPFRMQKNKITSLFFGGGISQKGSNNLQRCTSHFPKHSVSKCNIFIINITSYPSLNIITERNRLQYIRQPKKCPTYYLSALLRNP